MPLWHVAVSILYLDGHPLNRRADVHLSWLGFRYSTTEIQRGTFGEKTAFDDQYSELAIRIIAVTVTGLTEKPPITITLNLLSMYDT